MNITESPKFTKMCNDYLVHLKGELDYLRQAVEEADFEQVHQIAHKAKGTSGSYQLNDISSKARALQESADAKDAERLKDTFEELYDLVTDRLQNLQ